MYVIRRITYSRKPQYKLHHHNTFTEYCIMVCVYQHLYLALTVSPFLVTDMYILYTRKDTK